MKIIDQRMTADIEGDFVVFLIGMRINCFWKFWKWIPVVTAMPRMLKELSMNPESGLLGFQLLAAYLLLPFNTGALLNTWKLMPETEKGIIIRHGEILI